jgi:hypothetical protein
MAIALLSTSSGARWKSLRLVADAAGPVRRPDDEQAAELEQVDGGFVGVGGVDVDLRGCVGLWSRRSDGGHGVLHCERVVICVTNSGIVVHVSQTRASGVQGDTVFVTIESEELGRNESRSLPIEELLMSKHVIRLVALAIALTSGWLIEPVWADDPAFKAWSSDCLTKVLPDTKPTKDAGVIKVYGARGEVVSAQAVCWAREPLREVVHHTFPGNAARILRMPCHRYPP